MGKISLGLAAPHNPMPPASSRMARQRRRRAIAEKREDEPQVHFGGIAANLDLRFERRILAGLLDALP